MPVVEVPFEARDGAPGTEGTGDPGALEVLQGGGPIPTAANIIISHAGNNMDATNTSNSNTHPTTAGTTTDTTTDTGGRLHDLNWQQHQGDDGNLELKICSINTCGILSKLENGIFTEYLQQFDIFCVSETRTNEGPRLVNYMVINLENKPEHYPLPGIHGINIYIKNNLYSMCKPINIENKNCDSVIWVNILNYFILGAIYVPHDRSKYNYDGLFTDITCDLALIREHNLPIMLIGDLNSRTKNLNDIWVLDPENDDIFVQDYIMHPNIINIFNDLDIPLIRSNKDIGDPNKNGKELINLCKDIELCILNGRIGEDKDVGNTTFNNQSLIDYALCTPDLLQNITNFKVDTFDPLLSDKHCPIIVNLNFNNINSNAPPNMITTPNSNDHSNDQNAMINLQNMICKWDNEKKTEYQLNTDTNKINEIINKLSSLNRNASSKEEIDDISKHLQNIVIDAAKITGMCKQRSNKIAKKNKTNKPWFDATCKKSKQNYLKAKKSLPHEPSQNCSPRLKVLAKEHKRIIRATKRKYTNKINMVLKKMKSTNPGEYWRIINNGNKNNKMGNISLPTLFSFFQELNKNKSNTNSVNPITVSHEENDFINMPFTSEEIRDHISSLKNNKTPGVDNILNEFLKYSHKELIPLLVIFFNVILDTGILPSNWTIGVIKPLYKNKGDINDVNNYRGITLLSCIGKLFTSIINSRLYSFLTSQDILGSEQAGFRPQHSTLDHIFALHILSKFYIDSGKQLYCAFIDYTKAFDFIDRTYLWQKLISSQINGKVFTVIKNMYENAKSHISLDNRLSDAFPCQVGVRQGENLSPLLFAIYLNDFNKFLSESYNGLTEVTSSISEKLQIYQRIFSLLYADDTLVLAESDIELQKALDSLYAYCNKWALNVNTDKTKIIIFSKGIKRKYNPFKFGDKDIEVVRDYVYLGTTFNYNGSFTKAQLKQSRQARKATFAIITKIKQLDLTFETAIELFERMILPVLLYGSEIWGYENIEELRKKFDCMLRIFLRVHKSTPMCMIYGELGLKEISEYIDNRMLNFWRNLATGDENKISSILYQWIKAKSKQNISESQWFFKINTVLGQINMPELLDSITCISKSWFKNTVKTKLGNKYARSWSEAVSNNSVCRSYRMMTKAKKKYKTIF